ncbi:MAG: HAMP domain-containing protein [Acidimicrobiia bacterium]|nr:HAMP domain-containing protein [Acidimicrobiia bacterium]
MSLGERPFGLRLALWYAGLFLAAATLIVLLTCWVTATSLTQRDQKILQAKLGEYAVVYARGGLSSLSETVRVEQLTAPERLFVRVVDRRAEAIVLAGPGGWEPSLLERASVRLADGTLVQVGKSKEARLDLLRRVRTALSLVTLSILVLAFTGGWIATQSALPPVRRLTEAAGRIVRTGRTDERVTVGENDDALGELTRLFNAVLDRVEGLVTGMRGALDNVSHDLRTPLTRLRGTAETALAAPPDIDRYREALADCVEESDRVLVMLQTLMDISEAESGAMPLQRSPLDLSEVAHRAVELYRDAAEAKEVSLALVGGHAPAVGDRIRLEQVAANLLDNAAKYTPPGGRVTVWTGVEAGHPMLRVPDTGPGIPADELPHIWERLFRGDRSRSARGLGLGLSLVKAIVEAHP